MKREMANAAKFLSQGINKKFAECLFLRFKNTNKKASKMILMLL